MSSTDTKTAKVSDIGEGVTTEPNAYFTRILDKGSLRSANTRKGWNMWAQLMRIRLKPGRGDDLPKLMAGLEAIEQPGSGLLRSTTMVDQKDHLSAYTLVVFESEDRARAREQDPRRQEGLVQLRELMAEVVDGPPDFADLNVVYDRVY